MQPDAGGDKTQIQFTLEIFQHLAVIVINDATESPELRAFFGLLILVDNRGGGDVQAPFLLVTQQIPVMSLPESGYPDNSGINCVLCGRALECLV